MFHGINGSVTGVKTARLASESIPPLAETILSADIDLENTA